MSEPNPTDPVLSTNSPIPTDAAVLGGEAGKQQRLRSPKYRNYRFCHRFSHPVRPRFISPDNRYFYEIDYPGFDIRRIDIQTGKCVYTFPRVHRPGSCSRLIFDIALSHDGCLLAMAHDELTATLWRVDQNSENPLLYLDARNLDANYMNYDIPPSLLKRVAFTANDEYLFALASSNKWKDVHTAMWKLQPPHRYPTRDIPRPLEDCMEMMAVSADGSVFVGKKPDSSIEVVKFVCSSKIKRKKRELKRKQISRVFPDNSNILGLAVSPDNQWFAAVSENSLRLGHVETLDLREPISVAQIDRLVFTPDSRTLISSGKDGWVQFWDIPSGDQCGSLPRYEDPVSALVSSRDGTILLIYSKPKDQPMGWINVWELAE
ncbi:MAG: WD40 repeat domain-containing protein [Cyanobacteria bacterium P01_E01_bin.42]